MRLAGKRLDVGGVDQPPTSHIAADYFVKILLVKRDIALRHIHHAGAVGMATGDRGSKIGQASGDNRTQVTGSINPNLHKFSLVRIAGTLRGERRLPYCSSNPNSCLRSPPQLGNAPGYMYFRGREATDRRFKQGLCSQVKRGRKPCVQRVLGETKLRPKGTSAKSTQWFWASSRTKVNSRTGIHRLPWKRAQRLRASRYAF